MLSIYDAYYLHKFLFLIHSSECAVWSITLSTLKTKNNILDCFAAVYMTRSQNSCLDDVKCHFHFCTCNAKVLAIVLQIITIINKTNWWGVARRSHFTKLRDLCTNLLIVKITCSVTRSCNIRINCSSFCIP